MEIKPCLHPYLTGYIPKSGVYAPPRNRSGGESCFQAAPARIGAPQRFAGSAVALSNKR